MLRSCIWRLFCLLLLFVPLSSSLAQTPTKTPTPVSSPIFTPTSPAGGGGGGATHTPTPDYDVGDDGCPFPLPDLDKVAPEWAAQCSRCFATPTPGILIPTQQINTPSACIPDYSNDLTPTATPTACTEGFCPSFVLAAGGTGTPTATEQICVGGTLPALTFVAPTTTGTPTATPVTPTPTATPSCAGYEWGGGDVYPTHIDKFSGGSGQGWVPTAYGYGFYAHSGTEINVDIPDGYVKRVIVENISNSGNPGNFNVRVGGIVFTIPIGSCYSGGGLQVCDFHMTTLYPDGIFATDIQIYGTRGAGEGTNPLRPSVQLRKASIHVCPVPAPTNTPTATTTATTEATSTPSLINSPTPYGSVCSVVDWRDDTPAVVFDPPVIVDISCYRIVPEIDQWIFEYHLNILYVDLCIEWHSFPYVEILGIAISLDWLLIVPLAWIVRRFLTF